MTAPLFVEDSGALFLEELAGQWRPPLVLPIGWRLAESPLTNEFSLNYRNSARKLVVIISACRESDGRRWLHFSMSHKHRVPEWQELVDAKELFLGREIEAYQVFPPRSRYVNHCPTALHLWHCLEGEVLPDFRKDGFI